MVQWSPDTIPASVAFAGGYSYPDTQLRGFSLTHLSGTGCSIFQDVSILPTTVPVSAPPDVAGTYDVDPSYVPSFDHATETAEPGYYAVRLDPGTVHAIDVELATRIRSGVGRFGFPATTTAGVLFNAGGSAMANRDVAIAVDPASHEVSGSVAAGQFCYHRDVYTVYFVARFDVPFTAWGTWQGQTLSPGSVATSAHADSPIQFRNIPGFPTPPHGSNGAQAGAWVGFDTTSGGDVGIRVGVSFTSVAAARANLDAESPDFDVAAARTATRAAWNDALGRVDIPDGPPDALRTFYTMLYHALLSPTVFSDADGAWLGMDGVVHPSDGRTHYANYSGWDVYRTQMPLLALLDPARMSDMVHSLLADARESGWLPRWSVAAGQTDVMVGDPADAIIASAWALGARDFDTAAALAAMVKGATQTGTSPNAQYVERQGLEGYLRFGWIPHDGTERNTGAVMTIFGSTDQVWGSAATTLEYGVADFAIARFAAALGERATYRTFMRRSAAWRDLYDPSSGYLVPRYASGAFEAPFDPTSLEGFTEGDAAQYTWMVPFDPAGLFATLGGRRTAASRLATHFQKLNDGPQSMYAFLGNEPELGVPWLFDWLGQPAQTQKIVREAATTLFDATPAGYVGNDDLGAMSAWHVFAALGFYPPIAGEDVLALASPLFPEATVHLAGGDLTIHAPAAAADAPYVHRLRIDGRPHARPWLRYRDVACGARLDFDLTTTPTGWGTARRAAPPSFPPTSRLPRPWRARCRSRS